MKDLNRNGRRFPPLTYQDRVCRVLSDCAPITIESFDKLRTAKEYMSYISVQQNE